MQTLALCVMINVRSNSISIENACHRNCSENPVRAFCVVDDAHSNCFCVKIFSYKYYIQKVFSTHSPFCVQSNAASAYIQQQMILCKIYNKMTYCRRVFFDDFAMMLMPYMIFHIIRIESGVVMLKHDLPRISVTFSLYNIHYCNRCTNPQCFVHSPLSEFD